MSFLASHSPSTLPLLPPAIFPIRRSFPSLGKQVKEADGNQTVVDPIRDPLERCQSTAEFQ